MASIRREIRIDRPAADVWRVVGRPDLLHLWFPGMTDCTVDTHDGVTTRTIVVGAGIPMPERVRVNDPLQRRFQYELTVPAFRDHRGTIDVIEFGESSCLVVYSTDCVPDAMALVIGGATGGALEELARQFAAGEGPALEAVGLSTSGSAAAAARPAEGEGA